MMRLSLISNRWNGIVSFVGIVLVFHCRIDLIRAVNSCNGICSSNSSNVVELLPDPYLMVSGKTCLEWQTKVSSSTKLSEGHCQGYQTSIGAACGCTTPIETKPSCHVCPFGYKWGTMISYADGSHETCEMALFYMSTSTDICEYYAEQYSQVCCHDSCPIISTCPTEDETNIIATTGQTCGDIMLQASLLHPNSKDCHELQSLVQDQCQCNNNLPEECTLCPNGTKPTWENGIILGKHNVPMTCREVQEQIQTLEHTTTNDCNEIHAEGIYYCGCDLSLTGCHLCGNGNRVPQSLRHTPIMDPNGHTITCAEYEAYLNTQSSTTKQCQESTLFQSKCCSTNTISHLRKHL